MNEQFKVKVNHLTIDEKSGRDKLEKEVILFPNSISFTDAETEIYKLAEERSFREIDIDSITKMKYSDIKIVNSADEKEDGVFYEAVVKEEYEQDNGKIKIESVKYLIVALSVTEVEACIIELIYKDCPFEYRVFSVKDSGIKEIIEAVEAVELGFVDEDEEEED